MSAYTIDNGVELHAKYPDSFWIPSDADKAALAPGDFVKLIFNITDGEVAAERMWVKIVAVGPDEGYRISKRSSRARWRTLQCSSTAWSPVMSSCFTATTSSTSNRSKKPSATTALKSQRPHHPPATVENRHVEK